MSNICKGCKMFKTRRFNLLKKDKAHPRFYTIHCGLTPGIDQEEFKTCEYFKAKH